jgi:Uma2 family endonuclease
MTAAIAPPSVADAADAPPSATPKISFDEYLDKWAEQFYEFVDGEIVKMSPVSIKHALLTQYLLMHFNAYFEVQKIGVVFGIPIVMKLAAINRGREPDLMIILNTNPHPLKNAALDGPADIAIEIVSPESVVRDHGEKFQEYETGGVREYWILDPLRNETRFYRLDDEGIYRPQALDANGDYRTPLLPGFALHVPTLWQAELPTMRQIVAMVDASLAAAPHSGDLPATEG